MENVKEFFKFVKAGFCFFFAHAARALALRCCSCRKGISFLLPEQKKRNKENSPSALFCLLRHFSPLNKKNSLRSNSFLFLTLRKAPPLHGKKVRPVLDAFTQHCFARCSFVFSSASLACLWMFALLRSLLVDVCFASLVSCGDFLRIILLRDFQQSFTQCMKFCYDFVPSGFGWLFCSADISSHQTLFDA